MVEVNLRNPSFYTETFNKTIPCFYGDFRFNVIMGGSNSSKSYSVYQHFILTFLAEQKRDYLVLRKHGTSLYDSVFMGMKNIIVEFGIGWMFNILESPGKLTIINKSTGRRIVFKGLDDTEKIKSAVNFKYCLLEEANEFSLPDWLEVNRRLRGFEGIKFFFVFNPVSRQHWLNKHFFLTDIIREKTCFVHCTYHDNRFATKADIEELENLKYLDENDYRVYCLGEWGVLSSRIIFKNWKIIDEIPVNAKQIPSGMDFGMSPDPTTLIDLYLLPKPTIEGQVLTEEEAAVNAALAGTLIIDERIYDTGLVSINTQNELTQSIQGRLEELDFSKEQVIVADNSHNMTIREVRDVGYSIFAVKKPRVGESLKVMKSYQILITRRSTHVINEFENYMLKVDRNGVILPEPVDGNDHTIDPCRYVLSMKGRLW